MGHTGSCRYYLHYACWPSRTQPINDGGNEPARHVTPASHIPRSSPNLLILMVMRA